jgi:hypothetical protein
MALMISTSLGTPPYPNFLLNFERISFRETDWLASCALMSSAAIPEVTRRSVSAWDGPDGIQVYKLHVLAVMKQLALGFGSLHHIKSSLQIFVSS